MNPNGVLARVGSYLVALEAATPTDGLDANDWSRILVRVATIPASDYHSWIHHMTDLRTALDTHHQAVEGFLAVARTVAPSSWNKPRAPDKWSPGQVAEHVTLAYEVNRGVLRGGSSAVAAPRLLRPLIRGLLLRPVLRRGRFIPGSRSPSAFRPGPAPASQPVLLERLQAAADAFEKDARDLGARTIDHPFFGNLALVDFIRLQEIHTNHHRGQIPTAQP